MKKLLTSVSLSALALCFTMQFAHGMETVPDELMNNIVRYRSYRDFPSDTKTRNDTKTRYDVNFWDLFPLRLVSQNWKRVVDQAIIKDRLILMTLDSTLDPNPEEPERKIRNEGCFISFRLNPSDFKNFPEGMDGLLTTMRFEHSAGYCHWDEDDFDMRWSYKNDLEVRTFPEVSTLRIFNYPCRDAEYNASAHLKAIPALLNKLDSFPNVRELVCSYPIEEKGGEILGEMLPKLPKLETIHLDGANMGPKGTMKFADGLKHEKLKTLELTFNYMGDAGAKAIADKFEGLPNLEIVKTYSTPAWTNEKGLISEEGAKYFKEKVEKHNPKLKYLI